MRLTARWRKSATPKATPAQTSPAPGLHIIAWSTFWATLFVVLLFGFRHAKAIELLHPPKLLIAVAVWSTATFALYSVLLPLIRPQQGLARWSRTVFTLIIVNVIASFVLGFYYLDAALHLESRLWVNLFNLRTSLESLPFALAAIAAMKGLFQVHTLVFVLLILFMDFFIYKGALADETQAEFKRIFWFIDVPMVAGVTYANLLVIVSADDSVLFRGHELFLAGTVALQLLVANLQLLLLKWVDYLGLYNYFHLRAPAADTSLSFAQSRVPSGLRPADSCARDLANHTSVSATPSQRLPDEADGSPRTFVENADSPIPAPRNATDTRAP